MAAAMEQKTDGRSSTTAARGCCCERPTERNATTVIEQRLLTRTHTVLDPHMQILIEPLMSQVQESIHGLRDAQAHAESVLTQKMNLVDEKLNEILSRVRSEEICLLQVAARLGVKSMCSNGAAIASTLQKVHTAKLPAPAVFNQRASGYVDDLPRYVDDLPNERTAHSDNLQWLKQQVKANEGDVKTLWQSNAWGGSMERLDFGLTEAQRRTEPAPKGELETTVADVAERRVEQVDSKCEQSPKSSASVRQALGTSVQSPHQNPRSLFGLCHRIVQNPHFDAFIAFVVMCNSLLVGLQINHQAVSDHEYEPFDVAEKCCTVIFTIELLMRAVAYNVRFFNAGRRLWSVLDILLVVCAWLDLILTMLTQGGMPGPGTSAATIVKMARIARIMRIIRMVRFLTKVRIMATMILGSMNALFWLFILIMGVMYVFAIILCQGATDWRKPAVGDRPPPGQLLEDVEKSYGSLPRAMYTLFISVTGGISWDEPAELLRFSPIHFTVFLFYIFFTFFSVLNIVTGVFVDGAIQQASEDRSLRMIKEREKRDKYVEELQELLGQLDMDSNGSITKEEWKKNVSDEKVLAHMQMLDVDVHEVEPLFDMLDVDGNGDLTITEFVDGMQRLRGYAQSIDMHVVLTRINALMNQVKQFLEASQNLQDIAVRLGLRESEVNNAIRRLSTATASPLPGIT